jgi:hypothetical protein
MIEYKFYQAEENVVDEVNSSEPLQLGGTDLANDVTETLDPENLIDSNKMTNVNLPNIIIKKIKKTEPI